MKKNCRWGMLLWLAMLVPASGLSWAADFPTKPITLINPYAPGGTGDIIGRAFASVAEKMIGQPVLLTNRTGASGMIGGLAAAQAPPDGYTLFLANTGVPCALEWEIVNGRKPSFTMQDFIPIGSFTLSPALVAVYYDSPWKTLGDMIRDAKAKPGHYAASSGGLYAMGHLATEAFARALGLKFRIVPFPGGGPAISALVGKHVDFYNAFPPVALPLVEGKKVRVLAVQGDRRLRAIPDVPTVKELGIDAECPTWGAGILAPKSTPPPVVKKLQEISERVAKDRSFISAVEKIGDEVVFLNREEFAKLLDSESARIKKVWTQVAKDAPPK